LLQDPNLINKQPEDLPGQYYLKRILQSYHNIAEKGGWDPIVLSKKIKSLQRDTSDVILQIRKRLFITGDLIIDSRQKHLIMSFGRCAKIQETQRIHSRFLTVTTY
jgi:hypothetical protein